MSAIRPNPPPVPFSPQPAAPAPVRAARSDFFKAALDAVQTAGTGPAPRAVTTGFAPTAQEDRPARPGALLDIRV